MNAEQLRPAEVYSLGPSLEALGLLSGLKGAGGKEIVASLCALKGHRLRALTQKASHIGVPEVVMYILRYDAQEAPTQSFHIYITVLCKDAQRYAVRVQPALIVSGTNAQQVVGSEREVATIEGGWDTEAGCKAARAIDEAILQSKVWAVRKAEELVSEIEG